MYTLSKLVLTLAGTALLSGCASLRNTDQVAVDYNRTFASAQNKSLLLNILRASEREPLQFSTISNVSGAVRNSGGIELQLTDVLGGGKLGVTPKLSIDDGVNPAVTIIPLSQKEFTVGIHRAVDPATLDLFLGQGWDRELLLPLLIGGVSCSEEKVLILTAAKAEQLAAVQTLAEDAAAATQFSVTPMYEPLPRYVYLPPKDALDLIKAGMGADYEVSFPKPTDAVPPPPPPGKDGPQDLLPVKIEKLAGTAFTDLPVEACADRNAAPGQAAAKAARGATRVDTWALLESRGRTDTSGRGFLLRSPLSIIYFLGNLHSRLNVERVPPPELDPRRRGLDANAPPPVALHDLVDIRLCDHLAPVDAAISVMFRGNRYCVMRESKRTLEVFSFVNDLIALQTSEDTIRASAPVLTIPTK
jgi:hypothetical protein